MISDLQITSMHEVPENQHDSLLMHVSHPGRLAFLYVSETRDSRLGREAGIYLDLESLRALARACIRATVEISSKENEL